MKALISRDLQERIGAVLGDVVRMSIYTTDEGRRTASFGDELDYYDLRIVGSYEQQGQMETMYIPFDALLDLFDIWDAEMAGEDVGLTQEEIDQLSRGSFNSATFKLTDTKNLGQLKDFLSEYGYSQVNKIGKLRTFIVIDDAIFNNAVAGLQQQVRYVNTLYPFLYVLVGVIAFVVSYLLVVSRRMELATLRGLGASSLTTFMSFFLEQSLLCLIGVGLGMAAWRVLRGPFIPLHLWLILGFVGCYFVGSALSIGIMNRRNLLAILTDKD
jgi:ABC-type antimicrobial peptide transport system permease subunit